MSETNSNPGMSESASEHCRQAFDELVAELEVIPSQAQTFIEHHPAATATAAFLLGIILGSTWSTRK